MLSSIIPLKMTKPVSITLKKSARVLHIAFEDGVEAAIGFDRLRAASPAADAGDASGDSGRVDVVAIHPVGNYAIKPSFSDNHSSGIYSWALLYRLATSHERQG